MSKIQKIFKPKEILSENENKQIDLEFRNINDKFKMSEIWEKNKRNGTQLDPQYHDKIKSKQDQNKQLKIKRRSETSDGPTQIKSAKVIEANENLEINIDWGISGPFITLAEEQVNEMAHWHAQVDNIDFETDLEDSLEYMVKNIAQNPKNKRVIKINPDTVQPPRHDFDLEVFRKSFDMEEYKKYGYGTRDANISSALSLLHAINNVDLYDIFAERMKVMEIVGKQQQIKKKIRECTLRQRLQLMDSVMDEQAEKIIEKEVIYINLKVQTLSALASEQYINLGLKMLDFTLAKIPLKLPHESKFFKYANTDK